MLKCKVIKLNINTCKHPFFSPNHEEKDIFSKARHTCMPPTDRETEELLTSGEIQILTEFWYMQQVSQSACDRTNEEIQLLRKRNLERKKTERWTPADRARHPAVNQGQVLPTTRSLTLKIIICTRVVRNSGTKLCEAFSRVQILTGSFGEASRR